MPADLIIVQRNIVTDHALDAMDYFRGLGKVIAVDLDDQYQGLPWSNPAHPFWIENINNLDPNPLYVLEEGLRRSDGLIAPNRFLLQDWSHVCKGYYLQNYARSEWWSGLPERAALKQERGLSDSIVIGWGGSVSHYDSWWGSGLREAATAICKAHDNVVWLICGNDRRIYDQLPVPWRQKRWQPGVPPQEWPKVVQSFDIGVAPLFGPYDQRRSWIKGMEYSLAGVPWIGTGGEPYRDLQGLGMTIANSPAHWESALEQIINQLPQVQETTRQNVAVAQQKFFIDQQVGVYEQVYKEIIANAQASRQPLPGTRYVNW